MDVRQFISIALLCVAATGCQTTDPSIELLESELRWYEDQLFLQSRELDQRSAQLESCKRYNSALKNELRQKRRSPSQSGSGRSSSGTSSSSSSASSANDSSTNNGNTSQASDFDMSEYEDLELGVPDVQYGEEVDPPGTTTGEDTPSIEPDIERDQKTDPFTDESDDMTRINAAPQVAKIELNPRLTGGYDSDRIVGDEGIAVVIEPQSADGTYVPLPGEVTVEAYESGSSLSSNRIGRWDFSAFETADLIQESLFGKGVHLQLPWPGEAPRSDEVRIVVKFVDPSGQRLTAKRDVPIDAPKQNVASHPDSFPISKKRFATAIPQWKATR